jgi:hypothetical protein
MYEPPAAESAKQVVARLRDDVARLRVELEGAMARTAHLCQETRQLREDLRRNIRLRRGDTGHTHP